MAHTTQIPRLDGTTWIPCSELTPKMIASAAVWQMIATTALSDDGRVTVADNDAIAPGFFASHTRAVRMLPYSSGSHESWRPIRIGEDGTFVCDDLDAPKLSRLSSLGLNTWCDFDVAEFTIGLWLGLWLPSEFQNYKHVFWSNNILGQFLHEFVEGLCKQGILVKRDDEIHGDVFRVRLTITL